MQIFICGDSTAASYRPEETRMVGWGQLLGDYLPGITVVNLAMAGTEQFAACRPAAGSDGPAEAKRTGKGIKRKRKEIQKDGKQSEKEQASHSGLYRRGIPRRGMGIYEGPGGGSGPVRQNPAV